MKIRFFTDKLPKSCIECNIFISSPIEGMQCVALQKYIDWEFDVINKKLTDCPLELESEEVCLWERSENPNWYWKTACGDWFDNRYYPYCSCGKRIVYKEEE